MIKLLDIAQEILNEDRCKRIADRKYDKPSAYKSGAIVRCRKGNIWKGVKEGEYDNSGEGGQFTLVKENPFDVKKLVDKKIIFVTKPGNGEGGVEEPNWEGDASVITLYNMTKAEPWMKQAVKSPMPQAISYIQKDQDKLFYNGKYNQILWGINKMGLKPEDFYLNTNEGLEDTSWAKDDKKKITLQQLLDAIKDYPIVQAPIEKIEKIIIKKNSGGIESNRLSAADVKYPIIIIVDDNENYRYILDGNHRANKAIDAGLKSIPAKLVNIKKLPQEFQDVLSEAKKETLRTWFKRKGASGKVGGWVDCNTCRKDKKTGRKKCKSCGRQKGEKRAKYPSCRPTPSQCGDPGKGKSWGKTK
jgi:hypothetical protein